MVPSLVVAATVKAPKGQVSMMVPADLSADVDLYQAIKHLSLAEVLSIAAIKGNKP
jgi:hypothetical protein